MYGCIIENNSVNYLIDADWISSHIVATSKLCGNMPNNATPNPFKTSRKPQIIIDILLPN